MSAVNVTNVTVLDNPSMFQNPFQFEISYECLVPLKDDTVPSISVVLFCLITVGLLSTALVSGMLSVSSAILAAAGVISDKRFGNLSRNLLGLTCHLQVLALSGFLAVSLPVEYQEVTNPTSQLVSFATTVLLACLHAAWRPWWGVPSSDLSTHNLLRSGPGTQSRHLVLPHKLTTPPKFSHYMQSCNYDSFLEIGCAWLGGFSDIGTVTLPPAWAGALLPRD